MSRIIPFLLAVGFLVLPVAAQAKPWKGITPGKSQRSEVESKWGKPAVVQDNQGECVARLTYNGDHKPDGAKEVQVCVDGTGKVTQLRVFPEVELDKSTVEEAFGDEYRKKLSEDFLTYWHYEKEGLVVFFEKGGKMVKVLLYIEGKANAKKVPSRKGGEAAAPNPDEGAE